jgi:hypothetical protein
MRRSVIRHGMLWDSSFSSPSTRRTILELRDVFGFLAAVGGIGIIVAPQNGQFLIGYDLSTSVFKFPSRF